MLLPSARLCGKSAIVGDSDVLCVECTEIVGDSDVLCVECTEIVGDSDVLCVECTGYGIVSVFF